MRAAALPVAVLAVLLSACAASGVPDREPDAVGTVSQIIGDERVTGLLFAPEAGYEYFDQTVFTVEDSTTLEGVASRTEIGAGDAIEVWTGPCAESFPVQCDVVAVRVLD